MDLDKVSEGTYLSRVVGELGKIRSLHIGQIDSELSPAVTFERARQLLQHYKKEPLRMHVLYVAPKIKIDSINPGSHNVFLRTTLYDLPFEEAREFGIDKDYLILGTATQSAPVLHATRNIDIAFDAIEDSQLKKYYDTLPTEKRTLLTHETSREELAELAMIVYFPSREILEGWGSKKIAGVMQTTPAGLYCDRLYLKDIYKAFPKLKPPSLTSEVFQRFRRLGGR